MKMIFYSFTRGVTKYAVWPCFAHGMLKPSTDKLYSHVVVTLAENPVKTDMIIKAISDLGFRNVKEVDWVEHGEMLAKPYKSEFEERVKADWGYPPGTRGVAFDSLGQPRSLVAIASLIARHARDNKLTSAEQRDYDVSTPAKFIGWCKMRAIHVGTLFHADKKYLCDTWEEVGNNHRAATRNDYTFQRYLYRDYK